MRTTQSFRKLSSMAIAVLLATTTLGRTQPSNGPAFTVASLKPSGSEHREMSFRVWPAGSCNVRNHSLTRLISRAYELDVQQVLGGPDWIDDERFDIVANFEPDAYTATDESRVRRMLQRLLWERFALRLSAGRLVLPHYALVLARPDGTLGDGARPLTTDCTSYRRQVHHLQSRSPVLSPPLGPHCGMRGKVEDGSLEVYLGAETLTGLARFLQPFVGRPVHNDTGLRGLFDFGVSFVSDRSVLPLTGFGTPLEQLGLKLEARHGPVDVLVVTHAERLRANGSR